MKKILAALGLDIVIVALFVIIGTLSHEKSAGVSALLHVAWPFLAGLGLAWLAVQAWRRPQHVWPTGVFVAAITIVGAMTLRLLIKEGTELSFIVVTSAFLTIGLVGWRWLAQSLEARRAAPSAEDRAIIAAARARGVTSSATDSSATRDTSEEARTSRDSR